MNDPHDTPPQRPGAPTGARSASAKASPNSLLVHTRARQLLQWLLPALGRFPREHRHTVAEHMAALAMRTHDALVAARHLAGADRGASLARADISLDQLRQYALLACEWRWWSEDQYAHFSRLSAELGRLIGGWRRALLQAPDPPDAGP